MPTAPMLRGRSFITPLDDTFRDMAGALVLDRHQAANPISFDEKAETIVNAIVDGAFDPQGKNFTSFQKVLK